MNVFPVRSLPACLCLDVPPPVQDHGHPQPDAPPGKAQKAHCAFGRHVWPAADEGGRPEDYDPKAQEAQLCKQEVCTSAAV